MRQERKDSIFDNFVMPLAVMAVGGIIGGGLTFLGIKNSDPAYVFHDVITYDNVSDIIETYFVDYGLVDASILDLESPQDQMRMIRDIIQEQQSVSNETVSQVNDLLLTIGYDSETVGNMDEEEKFNALSSYLVNVEANENALTELKPKTLADLFAPSLVIQGESIDTTLQDFVAVINGKNYYQETFLNSYILDEQLSLSDGVLRYADSAPERMKVTDAVMHDNSNFVIVQETV